MIFSRKISFDICIIIYNISFKIDIFVQTLVPADDRNGGRLRLNASRRVMMMMMMMMRRWRRLGHALYQWRRNIFTLSVQCNQCISWLEVTNVFSFCCYLHCEDNVRTSIIVSEASNSRRETLFSKSCSYSRASKSWPWLWKISSFVVHCS